MGIFGKKKEEEKKVSVVKTSDAKEVTQKDKKEEVEKVEKTPEVAKPQRVSVESHAAIIKRPRITEKAALLSEKNVYVFEVRKGANKHEVKNAIKQIYNVTPTKVNIINQTPRHTMSRSKGRNVMTHGLRKAYVHLKEGDRIELI
jgi:large subunit ribosomal protein L23